jgi:integrase
MVLDHDVLPVLGEAQLGEITHEVVQEWTNQLAKRLAPSSVQRSFTVLRQVLDFAVDTRASSINPSDRTHLPRRQRFEARFLTADELEHLASTVEPRSRAMVLSWHGPRSVSGRRSVCGEVISTFIEVAFVLPTTSSRSPGSSMRVSRKRTPGDGR